MSSPARNAPRWKKRSTTHEQSGDPHGHARADRRPVLRLRPPLPRRPTSWCRRDAPDAIRLHGTVYDGAGQPVPDALIEIWQADEHGERAPPVGLAAPRRLHLHRLRPRGRRRARATTRSPRCARARPRTVPPAFFAMTVFARGLLNRLFTRVYLPDDEAALAADPLLQSVPEDRRGTLVAAADAARATPSTSGSRATARPSSWPSRGPDGRPVLARRRTGPDGLRRRAPSSRRSSRSRTPGCTRCIEAGVAPDVAEPTWSTAWSLDATSKRLPRPPRRAATPSYLWCRCCASAWTPIDAEAARLAAPRTHQPGRARHRTGACARGRAPDCCSSTSTVR